MNNKKFTQEPTCISLVFSDSIYRCPSTKKMTILGTFSTVFVDDFPGKLNAAVYCCMTDGLGSGLITVRFVLVSTDSLEDHLIAEAVGEASFLDPKSVLEFELMFRGVDLERPGEYRFQVVADETIIMERRLVVLGPEE